jgi:hypothetical protein
MESSLRLNLGRSNRYGSVCLAYVNRISFVSKPVRIADPAIVAEFSLQAGIAVRVDDRDGGKGLSLAPEVDYQVSQALWS